MSSPPEPPRGERLGGIVLLVVWIVLGVAAVGFITRDALQPNESATPITVSYSQLLSDLDAGRLAEVELDAEGRVRAVRTDGAELKSQIPTAAPPEQLLDRLVAARVEVTAKGPTSSAWATALWSFGPILALLAVFVWLGRRGTGGAIGSFSRAKAKLAEQQHPSAKLVDVAGYEGVKREVFEVVDYLRRPEVYHAAGAVGPGGVLMVGPPGTGKTLLARAIAGEAGVPFFSVTGSAFVELFVGVGAARVRDLFAEARKAAPAIVFIDEIDAIGARRGPRAAFTNDEREQTLNQLLAEMDGFEPDQGVVVLAATNRPDVLDPALLRPGRFDRQITVPLPNQAERLAILRLHCAGKQLGSDVALNAVARATPGFSGADLANLANEAAISAVRDARVVISAADFDAAFDRVVLGRRDGGNVLLAEEKQRVAVHEAGHALVAALSAHADPVSRVSILPAGAALGVTHQLPLDERHLYTESYLNDVLAVRLAGRAAEQLVLGEASSGAADDLAAATALALRMVREMGLSDGLGPVGYGAVRDAEAPGLGAAAFGPATQELIDDQVGLKLRTAEQRAADLLKVHRAGLDRLVAELIEHETLDGAAVLAALHERQSGRDAAQAGLGEPLT
ncbi:MAG: ATP-dependent zinc metalloprotease FtsH [Acidimicrobiales bacterium]